MASNEALLAMHLFYMVNIPTLGNSHLTLTPLSKDDEAFFLSLYQDTKTTKHLNISGSSINIIERLHFCLRLNRPNSMLSFVISCPNSKTKLGICAITWSKTRKEPEIGIHLKSDYFGKGYAITALTLLIDYAHSQLNISVLVVQTEPNNTAMLKTINRLPFHLERVGKASRWHIIKEDVEGGLNG